VDRAALPVNAADVPSRAVLFELGPEQRAVALSSPVATFEAGAFRVSLMDLWVATLLPGDVLDLSFELVAEGREGRPARATRTTLDGLRFGRGLVAIDSRELWWRDPRDSPLHGAKLLEVHVVPQAPIAVRVPPSRPPTPIERLLPIAAARYPRVVWREKDPAEAGRQPISFFRARALRIA
jgi:hypothetical protein